jgi:tripartite-type tricarboxylate transporter receptor subunit TctC
MRSKLTMAPESNRRAKLLAAAFSVTAVLLASAAQAQAQSNFPSRPVRLVNPYTPGGSVDLVGRSVAAGLTEIWGQQVIVDNRPGAGTQIGTEVVVRAEPDGYTMLCNSSAIAIMPSIYRNMRFDPVRDLYPVVQVAASHPMLAVNPGVPARSVKELIALAKSQPGQMTAAISGIGSTTHLTTEMFKSMAQIDVLIVPYKGGGPAMADFMGGQVKMFFNSAAAFLPLMKIGKVRVLATAGAQRADYAPEIPTVAESGVPGFEASTWFGIFGPRGLPTAPAQRWNDSVNQYLNTPQAKEYFRRNHMRVVGGTVASFTEFHKAETARLGKVIVSAGIKPQ